MTESTQKPDEPTEPASEPIETATENTSENKKALQLPPITRKRKILAAALIIAAAGYLIAVKHGAKQDEATEAVAKSFTGQQRDAMNIEIAKSLDAKYGGASTNRDQIALVSRVGNAIATTSDAKVAKIKFRFHLLAEPDSINLYALSSGDIYVTTALLNRMQTEGQLASVLAHGVAHVLAADLVSPIGNDKHPLPRWHYTAQQEMAADKIGLKLMSQTGYDPNAFASMLGILAKAHNAGADVSFFISHPNVPSRLADSDATIKELYPTGLPAVMSK